MFHSDHLFILDVSDLPNIIVVDSTTLPSRAHSITLRDDYLYMSSRDGLIVVDVHDPSEPLAATTLPVSSYDIVFRDNLAFLAADTSGLIVLDVSVPMVPTMISTTPIEGSARQIDLMGDFAWLVMYGNRLVVFDISDPASPVFVDSCQTPGYACDVGVVDDYAIVADRYSLMVYELADGASIKPQPLPLPVDVELMHSYPNPFNATTTIEFKVLRAGRVCLEIYDVLGRRVERLRDDFLDAGHYRVQWDAAGVSSGTYFVKLTQTHDTRSAKLTLIR